MLPGMNAATHFGTGRGELEVVDAKINRSTAAANTVTVPEHRNGDLLVAVCYHQPNIPAMTPPAGWDLVDDIINSTFRRVVIYQRVASSEPPNYTFTWGAEYSPNIVSIVAIRNARSISDVGNVGGSSGIDITVPSITTTVPGLLLAYYNTINSRTVVGVPAGMAKIASVEGVTPTHCVCAMPDSPVGDTGGKTLSWNSAATGSSGLLIQVG